jgi:signal transduction histidine kinase
VPFTSSLVRAYRSQGQPVVRLERVLAVGRAFLAVTALVAIYLDPTEPIRLSALVYGLLAAYAIYSVCVLAVVHNAARLTPFQGLALHGIDVLWTSVVTILTEGPVSPFFIFFVFVVLAAAYRWGFRATMATACVTIAILLVETSVAVMTPWGREWFPQIKLEVNRTIMRVAYWLLVGALFGYLSEQEKQARAEMAAFADPIWRPRVDLGIGGSILAVAQGLVRTFDAEAVAIVLQEKGSDRAVLWHFERDDAPPRTDDARKELGPRQAADWLFPDPGRAWHVTRSGRWSSLARWNMTEPGVWPLKRTSGTFPEAIARLRPCHTLTAANLGLADEWTGRIYLFDIEGLDGRDRGLHFLEALTDHIASGLTNTFLLKRLHSQASAAERARVAREIHDGTVQTLFGVGMKIEALRRRGLTAPGANEELVAIQDLLQHEVLALRELMQALKPIPIENSEELPDVLASVVERFRRDTGVSARFVTTGRPLPLPAAHALEIVRIVQEALVNVRKHSRARNVLVRMGQDATQLTLSVEDDGLGFDFEGALSLAELDRRRIGPAIIKERARVVGADLTIDSRPGVGARIELTVAEVTHG